jgi:hypothetical protein
MTDDEFQMTKEARMTKPDGNSLTMAFLGPRAVNVTALPRPGGARDSSRGQASLRAQPPVRRAGIVRPGGARELAPTGSRSPVSRAPLGRILTTRRTGGGARRLAGPRLFSFVPPGRSDGERGEQARF